MYAVIVVKSPIPPGKEKGGDITPETPIHDFLFLFQNTRPSPETTGPKSRCIRRKKNATPAILHESAKKKNDHADFKNGNARWQMPMARKPFRVER